MVASSASSSPLSIPVTVYGVADTPTITLKIMTVISLVYSLIQPLKLIWMVLPSIKCHSHLIEMFHRLIIQMAQKALPFVLQA
jgi:hypothetical protein